MAAINGAVDSNGGTYASQAFIDAYDLLGIDNFEAEKNIILITDGAISDYNTGGLQQCPSDSLSQIATQMKTGTYDSPTGVVTDNIPITVYTVNIDGGNNSQLNSISSGPEFQFVASDFDDFVDNVAGQIADETCEENPITGDTFYYYSASPCCGSLGLPDIVLQMETGYTPSYGTDTVIHNGNCYTIDSLTGSTFSGSSVDVFVQSEITTCSDSRCDCGDLTKIFLRNCCVASETISVLYSGSSTPTQGYGLSYQDSCWWYDSSWGGAGAVDANLTISDADLTPAICDTSLCECIVDDCPEQDIVIMIAGTLVNVDDSDEIRDGVIEIATSLQGNMSSGTTSIGALFFNSCDATANGVVPIISLTNNYTNFVNAIDTTAPQGGNGMVGYGLIKAYDMLVGSGSNPNAEKNIIVVTNTGFDDVVQSCQIGSNSVNVTH